jgi:ketosteroid isomerase-like protein
MSASLTASNVSNVSNSTRIHDLLSYVQRGDILGAMAEFYAPDASMQENANPPTVGLAANIEREKQFLAQVKEWRGFDVKAVGTGDGVSFYECTMDFINTAGQPVHYEQVAVQRWKNGKVVHERFYYDTGAK